MTGIVYKSTGSRYLVKMENNTMVECVAKGILRTKGIRSTNPVAVGDRVDIELDGHNSHHIGKIKKIHPRNNYLIRKSVNLSKQSHIIASNIDQVVLVITLQNPITTTLFIDRILVSIESYHLKPLLVFNKTDLCTDNLLTQQKELIRLYKKIGYHCIETSIKEKTGVALLKTHLKDKTNVFTGHSGVGKSSLINELDTTLSLKTSRLSKQHFTGQHTTTFAERFDLSFGASIIDTPGIKGFGLLELNKHEVSSCFLEFREASQSCKYYNCTHINEPKCGVKEALKRKEITFGRYQNYLLIQSDENLKHR